MRYAVAVVAVVAATVLRLALDPVLRDRFPLVTFYIAVVFTAWYAGLGPSVLAIVLGWLAVDHYFLQPYQSAPLFEDKVHVGVAFCMVGAVTSLLMELARSAERRARASAAEARRALEGELAHREWFRITLESIADAVITTDPTGLVASLNPVAESLTGWNTAEAIGRPLKQVFRTVDQETHDTAEMPVDEVVRGGLDRQMAQSELIARGDVSLPIEHTTAPIKDEQGIVTGVVIVFRDITERKRLERELKQRADELTRLQRRTAESLALLDTVFQSSPVGLAYLDRNLRYRRLNAAIAAVNGKSVEDHLGRTIRDILPEQAHDLEPQLRRVLETGEPLMNQEAGGLPGTPLAGRYFLVSHYPVRSGHEVIGVGMAAVDITERKQAEEALRETARRREEFLAVLSHELRNPLAPIQTSLELVRQAELKGEAFERELAVGERQVRHLTRLVDDLLDVSRISRGRIELHKEIVVLADAVADVIESFRPQIEERKQTLELSLPEEPIRLEADPTRLEQILLNLLTNAAKYTGDGGRIALRVEREGAQVVVRIRDTGIGISPEMLPQIFDMFVQGERRLEQSQGGMGIGLSLVKSLVEKHGGSVSAQSQGPGTGSEFIVRLPVLAAAGADSPPATRPSDGSKVPGAWPRRRILVVDDNTIAAEGLGRLLALVYGQEVQVVYDGQKALEVVGTFRPAIILLDLGMAAMDGYEVARRLRERPDCAGVRLVAVTGWGQEEDRRRTREMGFDLHLVKPVSAETLKELLSVPDLDHRGERLFATTTFDT